MKDGVSWSTRKKYDKKRPGKDHRLSSVLPHVPIIARVCVPLPIDFKHSFCLASSIMPKLKLFGELELKPSAVSSRTRRSLALSRGCGSSDQGATSGRSTRLDQDGSTRLGRWECLPGSLAIGSRPWRWCLMADAVAKPHPHPPCTASDGH